MKFNHLPILLIFFYMACDPCDDCDSLSYEPTIELKFINADSLSNLEDSLDVTATNSASINLMISSLNDTLTFLADSLNIINDSIANNGDLEEELQSIEEAIASFEFNKNSLSNDKIILDSLTTVMNNIKSVINSGLLWVKEIQIVETGNSLEYADSMTTYQIPLSLDNSFNTYSFLIGNETHTTQLDYDLFQELDVRRNVLVRAKNIMVVNHSFDSLDACEENCLDGEATYTFYF